MVIALHLIERINDDICDLELKTRVYWTLHAIEQGKKTVEEGIQYPIKEVIEQLSFRVTESGARQMAQYLIETVR